MIKKIAIVGNGKFDKKMGDYIDGFEDVLRMNRFPVGESFYNSMVGSKTTVYSTHMFNSDVELMLKIKSQGIKKLWIPSSREEVVEIEKIDFFSSYFEEIDFHDNKKNFYKSLNYPKFGKCTGISCADMAIQRGYKPTLFGFDFGCYGHYWDRLHMHINSFGWGWQRNYIKKMINEDKLEYISTSSCNL